MRSLMRNCFVYLVVMLAWLAGASLVSAQGVPTDTPGAFDPPDTEYTTGDDEGIDPAIERTLPVVDRHRAFLPEAADLTSRMPFPGNQGKLGSCQTWATAYAARSYYTSAFERRDLRESQNVRRNVFWIEPERLIVVGDRLIVIAFDPQRNATMAVGDGQFSSAFLARLNNARAGCNRLVTGRGGTDACVIRRSRSQRNAGERNETGNNQINRYISLFPMRLLQHPE